MTTGPWTENKRAIRRSWDRPILDAAFNRAGHSLSYFGLPGAEIEDLLDWRDVLGKITGVQRCRPSGEQRREDQEIIRRLLVNIVRKDVQEFELLRGTIEDVILDTFDQDGNVPQCNDGQKPQRMRFRYNLVNLDFLGGLGYARKQVGAKQVTALKKLFERQQGTDFVLLLTINVRDGIGKEIITYLEHMRDRAQGDVQQILSWYANSENGSKRHKLKAVVPLFVKEAAELYNFGCWAFPPVWYKGTGGGEMVHFAFKLTHDPNSNLKAFGQQRDIDLLNLPLICVREANFCVDPEQHEHYDFQICQSALAFLPQSTCESLLATVPDIGKDEVMQNE